MTFLFPTNNRKAHCTTTLYIYIYIVQYLHSDRALFFCQITSSCGVRRTLERSFAESHTFEARNLTVLRLYDTYRARRFRSIDVCVAQFSLGKPSSTTSSQAEIKCLLYSNLSSLQLFPPRQYCEYYSALSRSQIGAPLLLGWRNYVCIQQLLVGSDQESNLRPLPVPGWAEKWRIVIRMSHRGCSRNPTPRIFVLFERISEHPCSNQLYYSLENSWWYNN